MALRVTPSLRATHMLDEIAMPVLSAALIGLAACENPLPAEESRAGSPALEPSLKPSAAANPADSVPGPQQTRTDEYDSLSRFDTLAQQCTSMGDGSSGGCLRDSVPRFAARFDVDVFWQDEVNPTSPLFDPGRGTIQWYSRLDLTTNCPDGSHVCVKLRPCGVSLPPLLSRSSGAVVQMIAPDTLWDSEDIASASTAALWMRACPVDGVSFDHVTQLLGIALDDQQSAWPSYAETPFLRCAAGQGEDCFPDQDRDGNPGVTFQLMQPSRVPDVASTRKVNWQYTAMPIDANLANLGGGATELWLGLRAKLSSSYFMAPNCAGGSGRAVVEDIALRLFGCKMQNGSACNPPAATFVDQTLPVFHVLQRGDTPPGALREHTSAGATADLDFRTSAGGTVHVVRMAADSGSCADVRAAEYDHQ